MKERLVSLKWLMGAVGLAMTAVGQGQTVFADSEPEFSGVQGQDDWTYGYRDLVADGGAGNYDPDSSFIPFSAEDDQFMNEKWDLGPGAPWTEIGATASHPNGTNNSPAHWTVRRWTAPDTDFPEATQVAVVWWVAKTNLNGTGVSGRIHLNGIAQKSVSIEGGDGVGVRSATILTVEAGDRIDLVHTSVGPDGNTTDGSDGSALTMRVETIVDSDNDGIADVWEEIYSPGDLDGITETSDLDNDNVLDLQEYERGSNPTLEDGDGDDLLDAVETNTGIYVSAADTGTNPCLVDSDGDGISDPDELASDPLTDPNLADTDMDGFNDLEEINFGTDPTDPDDNPDTVVVADSRKDFSGDSDGEKWKWGYRNFSASDGSTNYDAAADFIPFPIDGTDTRSSNNFWDGTSYDWADDVENINPPWTGMGAENSHPNDFDPGDDTFRGDEHWTIRRWIVNGYPETTPVRVLWNTRKVNDNGDGVTGSIHVNGDQVDTITIGGGDTVGQDRVHYLNVVDGDILDLVLTPEGLTSRADGGDGSLNWMTIDERIPEVPLQSNGKYFVPADATDSDNDGLADFWELAFAPGDLNAFSGAGDNDSDGLTDLEEQTIGSAPNQGDTDGDGINDFDEVAGGSNPCLRDSDDDGFDDAVEVATGYDPADKQSNVDLSQSLLADSADEFPSQDVLEPQSENGWDYGYYNITADGIPSSPDSYVPFPIDGSGALGAANFWNTNVFDWVNEGGEAANPPWTLINRNGGHPNGDNNGDVHWAVRRWTSENGGPLAVTYSIKKNGLGGNGTTAVILVNGEPQGQTTVGGTDNVGLDNWYFVNTEAGDSVEIALTPEGLDGTNADGSDSSQFMMWITGDIPSGAAQPDGTPFVAKSGLGGLRVISVDYNAAASTLTLEWTSKPDREYAIRRLTETNPIEWTIVGSVVEGSDEETTATVVFDVTDPKGIYHVLELEP